MIVLAEPESGGGSKEKSENGKVVWRPLQLIQPRLQKMRTG
jgi:hypothetical protein